MELQIAEDLASILSFVILLIGAIAAWRAYAARQNLWQRKRRSLEAYLRAAASNGTRERTAQQVIQDVGITEDEAIRISFESGQIGRLAGQGQTVFFWTART
jgi:hypothetical protein